MPNKIKKFYYKHGNSLKTIGIIAIAPFCLVIINLMNSTIFNLGIYTGTFIRYLYEFIVH